MNLKPLALIGLLVSTSVTAAYMPSPTQARGDRVRVKGQSGVEIDATYAPDMTLQFGAAYGDDRNNEHYKDWDRNDRYHKRDQASVYAQVVIPITFGERKKPDPNRLYEIELATLEQEKERMRIQLEIMKAALEAGVTDMEDMFDEGILM